MKLGYIPFFIPNKNGNCNYEGWYNFSVTINGYSDTMVNGSITFDVGNDNAEDDYKTYQIDLTEAEQIEVYKIIDKQLRERFNVSCDEVLEEARLKMEV